MSSVSPAIANHRPVTRSNASLFIPFDEDSGDELMMNNHMGNLVEGPAPQLANSFPSIFESDGERLDKTQEVMDRNEKKQDPQQDKADQTSLSDIDIKAPGDNHSVNMDASSEFPQFSDGDVEINIRWTQSYQLHSNVLRSTSSAFARFLKPGYAADLSSKTIKQGIMTRYRLDLHYDTQRNDYNFRVVPLDKNGKSDKGNIISDIDNGRLGGGVFKDYDNLFRTLYGLDPKIDTSSMSSTITTCHNLVYIANKLGGIKSVARFVEIAFLDHGQSLYRSISADPVIWIDIGYKICSTTIFKEALIHLVGQWNTIPQEKKETLNKEVLDIVKRKLEEMNIKKQAIEIRILGHYPMSLPQSGTSSVPFRSAYAKNVFMWMVISLFRHFFAQAVIERRTRDADDGGAAFYRRLWEGGQAYLDRTALAQFHESLPVSSKAKTVFENHMNAYKAEVKSFVRDLISNNARLDVIKHPTTHLTCCVVDSDDYPWKKSDQQENNVSSNSMKPSGQIRKRQASDSEDSNTGKQRCMEKASSPPTHLLVDESDGAKDIESLASSTK
ncbi:MAG: hypothetical protein M1834_009135 [Cirrosporium novae-zelandiae]|nr:MAG: hypothetical protein M1834_009135 [Cirrosporium novae-zelandiae]